jgi:hypothetical protein
MTANVGAALAGRKITHEFQFRCTTEFAMSASPLSSNHPSRSAHDVNRDFGLISKVGSLIVPLGGLARELLDNGHRI